MRLLRMGIALFLVDNDSIVGFLASSKAQRSEWLLLYVLTTN